jgi:hypothetical protein
LTFSVIDPEAHATVFGRPGTVGADASRQLEAWLTVALRVTSPPDAASVCGEAVKSLIATPLVPEVASAARAAGEVSIVTAITTLTTDMYRPKRNMLITPLTPQLGLAAAP